MDKKTENSYFLTFFAFSGKFFGLKIIPSQFFTEENMQEIEHL